MTLRHGREELRIKEVVLTASRRAGVTSLIRDSAWRRRRVLILCYHGISQADEHLWNGALYVPQEHLVRRLEWLRANRFSILPLREALMRMESGTLPARTVAITFDDGAIDFSRCALPALQRFDAHATLFLTTHYVEHRFPVFDTMLSYVLWKGMAKRADLAFLGEACAAIDTRSKAGRDTACLAVRTWTSARHLDTSSKDTVLRAIAANVEVDYDALCALGLLQLMPPETIRNLPRSLVDIQLHSHRHKTPNDEALFERELLDNATSIRTMRQAAELDQFCYPGGEYYDEFLAWLPRLRVKYATTCLPGLASAHSHPLLLPRFVDTAGTSQTIFEAWATGVAHLLPLKTEYRIDRPLRRINALGVA